MRYQNFFLLDEEGLHSELIFEDQLGVHHAVFPAAAEAGPIAAEAIVPVFSDVALGSLIGASGLSALAALGGIAAIGGVIGVAAAASNSGDSHDNKQSTPTTPTITITPVATDNIINKQEIGSAQTVSGSVQSQFAGSTLTISLNGQTWSTTINADGTWTSQLPLSLLQTLADGTYHSQSEHHHARWFDIHERECDNGRYHPSRTDADAICQRGNGDAGAA